MTTKTAKESIEQIVNRHKTATEKTFTKAQYELMEEITKEFITALKAGNKILFCGNGGSASDSQHIAAEFIARFKKDRQSLAALALTTDTSILTAVANDYSFEHIFSRQVDGLGQKGDILVAISTSGNSNNVLKAAEHAKDKEMLVVGFTGGTGGRLRGTFESLCLMP